MQKTHIGQIFLKIEQVGDNMTLQEIKQALLQTSFGEFITGKMRVSEPIPLPTPDGILENFFIYLFDEEDRVFSPPVARVGLFPDRKSMAYFIPCSEKPFSKKPEELINALGNTETINSAYAKYEELFNLAHPLFFHKCSPQGSQVLDDYLNALVEVTDPALFPFYIEMAPAFFLWLKLKDEIIASPIENKSGLYLNKQEKSIE